MIPLSVEVGGLSTNTVRSRWRKRLYFKALCIFYKFNILKGRAFSLRLWKWCSRWSKEELYRMLVPGHLCSVNKPRGSNVICALVLRCCLCWQNATGISFQNRLCVSTPVASRLSAANDCWSLETAGAPAVSPPRFILHQTAGKATQEVHAAWHLPLWGETRDEDESSENQGDPCKQRCTMVPWRFWESNLIMCHSQIQWISTLISH